MNLEFKNIYDMMKFYYSGLFNEVIGDSGIYGEVRKDAPVLSTTTGVYNAVYGAQVWAQINQEANIWALLPKYPWQRSGWRVMTARAGSSADGGVAENGAIPATIKPTFAEIATKPKTVVHAFDVSMIQEFLSSKSGDDAIGDMAQMRTLMATKHIEALNQQLLRDVDTVAGNGFESIDRVCSSYAELTNLSLDAGDSDIYSLDRDAGATYTDAYVDDNSGTDRILTDKMIRTLINTTRENGANPMGQIMFTGYDTYTAIQGLYDSQVRYNPISEKEVSIGVNGVSTPNATGNAVGLTVTTVYTVPLFISKDVTQDTISRIYCVDISDPEGYGSPRLGLAIAAPTLYFEAGINKGDPFGINRLGNEGVFVTMGELICRFFKAQGKIRDLK